MRELKIKEALCIQVEGWGVYVQKI